MKKTNVVALPQVSEGSITKIYHWIGNWWTWRQYLTGVQLWERNVHQGLEKDFTRMFQKHQYWNNWTPPTAVQ